MAAIKLLDTVIAVDDNHLITFTEETGDVFKTVQCVDLSEVLKEVAIFAISEYRMSPVDSEFETIQAVR